MNVSVSFCVILQEKQVTCTTERCPHVTCAVPIQQDGVCCPACA